MTMTLEAVHTPADALVRRDSGIFELIDGELNEKNVGAISSQVGLKLGGRLDAWALAGDRGEVFGADTGFQCFDDDPKRVRKPDVSFVSRERMAPEDVPEGHVLIAPDLAVEVVSPHDTVYEIESKVREYLAAGVRLVWLINPDSRSARVHRGDGSITGIAEDGTLQGEDVLPGFACRLGDVLPVRRARAKV